MLQQNRERHNFIGSVQLVLLDISLTAMEKTEDFDFTPMASSAAPKPLTSSPKKEAIVATTFVGIADLASPRKDLASRGGIYSFIVVTFEGKVELFKAFETGVVTAVKALFDSYALDSKAKSHALVKISKVVLDNRGEGYKLVKDSVVSLASMESFAYKFFLANELAYNCPKWPCHAFNVPIANMVFVYLSSHLLSRVKSLTSSSVA